MDTTLLNLYEKLEEESKVFVSVGDLACSQHAMRETLEKIKRRKAFIIRNYSNKKKGGETKANNSRT